MSFVELTKAYGSRGLVDCGVLFGVTSKINGRAPAFSLYLYDAVLQAAQWTVDTRLVMCVGTLMDAGIIRLVPSSNPHALVPIRENAETARMRIRRAMTGWPLPPMPHRVPKPVKRWEVREDRILQIVLPGAFAEELRAAQERCRLLKSGGAE